MSDLSVGRELDALVAERVMGWTGIDHGPGCDCCVDTWEEWTGLPPLPSHDDGERFTQHPTCGCCGYRPDKWAKTVIKTQQRATILEYSTLEKFAHEVLAKMHEDGWKVVWTWNKQGHQITLENDHEYCIYGIGEAFPLAVCHAALKTAENTINEEGDER